MSSLEQKQVKEFEKQVRKALIDMDMNLSSLADQLQISTSYVYEIIKGTRKAEGKKQEIKDFLGLKDTDCDEQIDCQQDCGTDGSQ